MLSSVALIPCTPGRRPVLSAAPSPGHNGLECFRAEGGPGCGAWSQLLALSGVRLRVLQPTTLPDITIVGFRHPHTHTSPPERTHTHTQFRCYIYGILNTATFRIGQDQGAVAHAVVSLLQLWAVALRI